MAKSSPGRAGLYHRLPLPLLMMTLYLLLVTISTSVSADHAAFTEDKDELGDHSLFSGSGNGEDRHLDSRLVDEVTRILEATFAKATASFSADDKGDEPKDGGRHFEIQDDNLDASIASFPDKPLQLVRPDSQHKRLELVEENIRLLHSIRQPVSTVAVVGKYHSGKSFLLNQIMAKGTGFGHGERFARSGGFGIGSAVAPQTMGIWAWGRPIKVESKAGSGKPPQWVLLLDTEGFAATNVSENYDAKIFAVATLLSAQLLYNSVKIIDQSDIDYLELLARRTQLFALKAQMTPLALNTSSIETSSKPKKNGDWTAEDAFSPHLLDFPKLIWVIQDFVQETTKSEEQNQDGWSCRDWLLRLLSTHAREAEAYTISLKDIFPAVDCHTLFIPSANRAHLADLSTASEADLTVEYRAERDALLGKLRSGAVPKRLRNPLIEGEEEFTGTELALLLRILVNAANAGSLTDIPNRWDAFLEQLQKSAVEDCYRFYQAHLASLISSSSSPKKAINHSGAADPVNERRLAAWHNVSSEKAYALLAHLLHGLPKSLETSRPELTDHLARYFASVSELNRQKIHLHLFNLQKAGELKVVDAFLATPLPVLQRTLEGQAAALAEQVTAEFIAEVGDLVDQSYDNKEDNPLPGYLSSLDKAVRLNLDSTLLRNALKLEALMENATQALLETAFSEVSVNVVRPPKQAAFETTLRRSMDLTLAAYARNMAEYAEERPIYSAKEAKLKLGLLEKAQALREDNAAAVTAYLKSEAGKLRFDFERLTAAHRRHFPMDAEELAAVLAAESRKFRRIFSEDYRTEYGGYGALFEAVEVLLKSDLEALVAQRQSENFAAFKEEVEAPLAMAKSSVLLSSSRYGTLFSWRRFAVSSALLQLEQGRARGWSPSLKAAIIESWMREDAELAAEMANRSGLFSRVLGFFQWLISLVIG